MAEKEKIEVDYNEDSIRSLDWKEHIRLRPGMYIGKLGDGSSPDDGIYVLIKEVIDNCIDEHTMGYGRHVDVTISGKSITVRVNDRGPFVGGRVIDLSHEAARQLDYDRKGTAQVRVRYVGPAPINSMPAAPQYAANTAPYAAAPTSRPFIVTPSTPPEYVSQGYTPPPVKVAATALPPLTPAAPAGAVGGVYKVQAGAFGDQANAQRAVSQLAGAGSAVIEPVNRDGVMLYRVMLQASADETQAWDLRDRVAAYGFSDARVIRPF